MTTVASRTLQAVLIDMDGTLVDTEDFWWEAESTLLAELGHPIGVEEREIVVGGPMTRVVDHLLRVSGAPLTPERLSALINERFVELIGQGVPVRPGAKALLADLAAQGVPTALVSASHRRIIDQVLLTLGAHFFAFTVAGDEIARTKPYPDPYLLAAARLGADPTRCVVIEDAPTGVRSGQAAGCHVLAVPSVTAIEAGPRTTVRGSLEGVDTALLRALLSDG
ncbi:HAD family hydrolase [Streptacidiphilus rugosus]|uniref:HAD family hydrolase n=1 Tax=Streptacidiphilus rugosus TaxID=405783 RepID=UPI00055F8950|nr:HAD family phosphatase [Streptacidiphilus rugosus]